MFIFIFAFILVLYFLFHFFAYFSIISFYGISDPVIKKVFLVIIALLAAGFFVTLMLTQHSSGIFSKNLYFLSGLWIGFLINLVMFFALAWALRFVEISAGFSSHNVILASTAILASLAFSSYGVWNAFTPVVRHVEISLKNSSPEWQNKKIVQISDLHLGNIYGTSYLNNVIRQINSLDPDIVAITGDLFDSTDGNLDGFADSLSKLEAKDAVFYVTGNHETYLGKEKVFSVLKNNITPLEDALIEIGGVQIIGAGYPERMVSKNIAQTVKNIDGFDPEKPSILLAHAPSQIQEIKNIGISLLLSGHTHKGQIFPFGFITSLVFNGWDYGFKKDGDFAASITSGLATWGPPMRTEKRSEIVEITFK